MLGQAILKRSRDGLVTVFCAASLVIVGPTGPALAANVGTTAAVNTDAFGLPPGGTRSAKILGDNVVFNERVETSGSGLVQILLNDGSTFTVGANSDLVIDEFVYDPEQGTGKLVATFSKGVARFVGGKISKNRGGVTVKTPVGTLGIRGGMADMNLAAPEPVFSFLFGEELTFEGPDGSRKRVYQAGYSLQVGQGGSNSRVRRTTPTDLSSVQSSLSSSPSQSGGTPNPPTDNQVANSDLPGINSDLSAIVTAPPPKPQAVQTTEPIEVETEIVQIQETTENKTGSDIADDLADENPIVEEPLERTVNVRIMTAGTAFNPVWDSSRVTTTPGAQGLIGGGDGLSQTVPVTFGVVTAGSATELATLQVEGNDIFQFVFDGDGSFYYAQTLTDQGNVVQDGAGSIVPVVPTVDTEVFGNVTSYAWGTQVYNENFAAFAHLPNVDPFGEVPFDIEDMVVGLYGVATDFGSFGDELAETKLRHYELLSDPTTLFSLGTHQSDGSFRPTETNALFLNPLVAAELGADFLKNVEGTGLLMLERSNTTLEGAPWLAASFHIEGKGSEQSSLISVSNGGVFAVEPGDPLRLATSRRGGHRINSTQSSAVYGGAIDTLTGPDGGHFFGTDAQSFVIGADLAGNEFTNPDDPYGDSYVIRPEAFAREQTISSSLHVGQLRNSSTYVGELTRTDRTLSGYAAGSLESTVNTFDYEVGVLSFASSSPDDLSITFNSDWYTLGGNLKVRDVRGQDPEVSAFSIRFGFNADGSRTSRGVFIDDDTYVARQAANRTETFLETDNGQVLTQDPGNNPNTYLVPNTLVPEADDAIMDSVTECKCDFLEWGYWGTRLTYDEDNTVLSSEEYRSDQFHLGTWVAGDVTNSGSLPMTGSASYAGHAVGNVINGNQQYLAAGDFGMTVDFGTRTGTATISDFDNRTFGANLTEQTLSSGNLFSGNFAGETIGGTINTSIVAGPGSNYQGVIGNFDVVDGNWQANGVVAGEMQ